VEANVKKFNPSLQFNLPTRRQMVVGAAMTLGGLAAAPVCAHADDEISHVAEAIHEEVVFPSSRKRLYEAVTDARQFQKVMQLSAAVKSGMVPGDTMPEISKEEGGPFTIYGGHIVGRHIELAPDERIVQAWRVVDWKPGIYSIARFELNEQDSSTKLIFDHTGFPTGLAQHLAAGWKANYWEPLGKYLAGAM
jgi:activator of HSP90 ATPase